MRRAGKVLLIGAVVAALGAAGTVYAYAGGWAVEGAVTFAAKVEKMPRGVEPSVAKQSRQAVVTWSAQELAPGVRMDHYVVTAHSDSTPPKPDVTRTVAASGGAAESATFTVAEVAGGRWRWTVAPRFRNWTGAESPKSRRLTFPVAPAGSATPPVVTGDEVIGDEVIGDEVAPRPPAPVTTTSPAAPRRGAAEPDAPEQPAPPKAGDTGTPPATDPEPAPPGPAESASTPVPPASSGPAAAPAA